MSQVLGHSEAEKAFRPWWDSLEDYLLYGLVMIGVVLVPTTIITGTPLDCNYCSMDYCGENVTNSGKENPNFNIWWVKKFCTFNGSLDNFLLYYPYFLLLIALILFAMEKLFLKTFKAGHKLEKFYSLINEKVLGLGYTNSDLDEIVSLAEGIETVELRYSFKASDSYFLSYLSWTVSETLIAFILLGYMIWSGIPILQHSDTIICDAHGFYYECHGNPTSFYVYSLYVTCLITITYIICNIYNILWLICPCLGKLSRVMAAYKFNMRERLQVSKTSTF